MAKSGQIITLEQVVAINRRTLRENGGSAFVEPHNFLNRNSLEYILGMLDAMLFGQECYPTLAEKAAALGWHIITSHIFNDGNKRTGLISCELFLLMNGMTILRGRQDRNAELVTLRVAENKMTLAEFTRWVSGRIKERT